MELLLLAMVSAILWELPYLIKSILKSVISYPSVYLLAPAAPYELQGDVPNVVFPCASLQDGDQVAVYYGAADTVVGMAFGYI